MASSPRKQKSWRLILSRKIAELARMVKEGFDSVQQQLDVRGEVDQLKVPIW